MAAIGNLGKFGATFRLGTVFAPRQCLYQKEATGVGSLKMYRFLGAVNTLAVTGLQTTRFDSSPYMAAIGNLGKFGATFRLGTVFAPRQCLYQKEATGVGSLKM